jgi:hypothetical protein
MVMKRQMSFAEVEGAGKKRVTKRQRFLAKMEKADQTSALPGQDGEGRTVGAFGVGDQAVLPAGRARPTADWSGADASHLLSAAVVQPVGRGSGTRAKWHVALKRGKIKAMRDGAIKDLQIAAERTKAQIRARVETSVPCHQKSVWSSQGSLQGAGQEHGATVQLVWPRESGACQEAAADQPWEHCVLSAQSAPG